MSVPPTLASPDSAGFLVRGAFRVALSRLGISRFFAAIASPVQALAVPSFVFSLAPELAQVLPAPRLFRGSSCWELDRRPSAPFSWESQGFCHEIGRPMSPDGVAPDIPFPAIHRSSAAPRPFGRGPARTMRFPPSQDDSRRERVRYPTVVAQDAFDWSEILFFRRTNPAPGVIAQRATCSATCRATGTPFHPSPLPAPSRVVRAAAQG